MSTLLKYVLSVSTTAALLAGCGEDPLCAEKDALAEQAAASIQKTLSGGTRSDADEASRVLARLAEVGSKLKAKNVTCKE